MTTRIFDVVFSLLVLIFSSPILLVLAFWVAFDSKGGVLYLQNRVGKNGQPFKLIKLRTMVANHPNKTPLTTGDNDTRITQAGKVLRKYKLDELTQFFNVLIGQMSIVGPRPETPNFVEKYTEKQRRVLDVKPGITDLASIIYFDENKYLEQFEDPIKAYEEKVMSRKLKINLKYIEKKSLATDMKIILKTVKRIFKG